MRIHASTCLQRIASGGYDKHNMIHWKMSTYSGSFSAYKRTPPSWRQLQHQELHMSYACLQTSPCVQFAYSWWCFAWSPSPLPSITGFKGYSISYMNGYGFGVPDYLDWHLDGKVCLFNQIIILELRRTFTTSPSGLPQYCTCTWWNWWSNVVFCNSVKQAIHLEYWLIITPTGKYGI